MLKAIYSGDANERGAVLRLAPISRAGSSGTNASATAYTNDPLINLYPATNPSATLVVVIAYTGNSGNTPAAAPTGTVLVQYDVNQAPTQTWAVMTLGTASGNGTSDNGNAYTYSCGAADATTQTVTCTVTMPAAASDDVTEGDYSGFTLQATYSGDTNYGSAEGYGQLYGQFYDATNGSTFSLSGSSTSTYGSAASVEFEFGLTASENGGYPCGGSVFFDVHSASASGPVASPYEVGNVDQDIPFCEVTGDGYGWAADVTLGFPNWLSPGTYTFESSYTGNAGEQACCGEPDNTTAPAASTYTPAPTLTVNRYTPALGSVSATPGSVAQGASTPVTLSGTMTIPSVGVLPSGTVNYILNGANYAATCSYTDNPGTLNCTASIPSATVAALGSGTYPITSSFAGDNFYTSATGTGGNLEVNAPPITISFTSVTHNFGSEPTGTAAAAYGIQVKNPGSNAYPFSLNFTAAHGFTSATNCGTTLGAGKSCELVFYWTPTATGTVSASWSLTPANGFTYSPSNGGTLSGTGTSVGGVTLTTAGHNFGSVALGQQSATYGTELSNSTGSTITLNKGSLSAPFTLLTNCGTTLGAGQNCEIEFYYTPSATGVQQQIYTLSANGVTITSGGATLPNGGITLTGTGN